MGNVGVNFLMAKDHVGVNFLMEKDQVEVNFLMGKDHVGVNLFDGEISYPNQTYGLNQKNKGCNTELGNDSRVGLY